MTQNKDRETALVAEMSARYERYNNIDPMLYNKIGVKRALRNADGTGVVAGLTKICNVHGYIINEGEKIPREGELIYRGINIKDIIKGAQKDDRFFFEEVAWLLLIGKLPNERQLEAFKEILYCESVLPEKYINDILLNAPTEDIMNKLSTAISALYPYDKKADDTSLANSLYQSLSLIAKMPAIIAYIYLSKNFRNAEKKILKPRPELSVAENFLYMVRGGKDYTDTEAKLLDLCFVLHAEHGGGNNSTFTTRVLTSSGTDIYGSISGAVSSLKGPKHGGANAKVCEMIDMAKKNIKNWNDDEEIMMYLSKLVKKEAGDMSGLIYGMGHAVYTLSDPRAVILKANARELAAKCGKLDEFNLISSIERLAPEAFFKTKRNSKVMCANVDMYSGLVYEMLGIPKELFTPLFALSRTSGWCAHRLEELTTNGRIMRPAYKSIMHPVRYQQLKNRK